jgi:hypothetical protein
MISFSVSTCDISEIVLEIIRYLSHIILLHTINFAVNNDVEGGFLNISFLKTLLYTCIAVLIYHVVIKKIFSNSIARMKKICRDNIEMPEAIDDKETLDDHNDYEPDIGEATELGEHVEVV